MSEVVKIFLYDAIHIYLRFYLDKHKMPKIRKIIKKKKKNEAKEALAKASGGEELEIAAKILSELRERNKRKRIIENKS